MTLKSKTLAVITITTLATTSAYAGKLSDWLFGAPPANRDCAIDDSACILDFATKLAISHYNSRDHKPNYSPHAKNGSRLLSVTPEGKRDAYLELWQKAGGEEGFYKALKRPIDGYSTSWIKPANTRKAFEERDSLVKGDFEFFAKYALEVLFKSHPQEALKIWEDHAEMLAEESTDALILGHRWVARHDIEAFERFAAKSISPSRAGYESWEDLAYIAARHCEYGRQDQGKRVLAVLTSELATIASERERLAMRMAPSVEAILYCQGEAAGVSMLQKVMDQTAIDLRFAQDRFKDERERDFVLGVIRSEVSEGATQPFALWLEAQGRREDAIKVFNQMPYAEVSWTLGAIEQDGILGMEAARSNYENFLNMHSDVAFYSDEPEVALNWFITQFDNDFSICCIAQKRPLDAVDMAAPYWPQPIAIKTFEAAIDSIETGLTAGDLNAFHRDQLHLKIATLYRESMGCVLSDSTAEDILGSVPLYRYNDQKIEILAAYLKYLDTPSLSIVQGYDCLID